MPRRSPRAAVEEMPTELQEQIALFKWAGLMLGRWPELQWLYHVSNEGKRSLILGSLMKRAGLKSGVPDLCLPVARYPYHGLYIEMKRRKGGRLTQNQSEWLEGLKQQGYKTMRCDGWEPAAQAILEYLKIKERWQTNDSERISGTGAENGTT